MRILMHVMYTCMLCARLWLRVYNSGMTQTVQSLIEYQYNQVVFIRKCNTNNNEKHLSTMCAFSHFIYMTLNTEHFLEDTLEN